MVGFSDVLKKQSILIGGVDIVEKKLSSLTTKDESDLSQNADIINALTDIKKEMRIRIGTMLKTDNVSFLLGAVQNELMAFIQATKILQKAHYPFMIDKKEIRINLMLLLLI